ncbi:WhiB family transcriptional regulator [Streptomyces sp. NPDC048516]|uniref:WhiB family transcriptional regulator n=1 Tax=Streptomyces sp. NPDC048516 TaxID=3365565 RepID=UPI0037219109
MHEARRAWMNLTEHRHYAYRGCAPDLDEPTRAQGDLELGVDAWLPYTEDDGEAPSVRIAREKAAAAVCASCPVLAQCRAYGLAETPDGKLAEPEGVLGGMRSLERHRDLIARRRTAEPTVALAAGDPRLDEARTPQKQAVLAALARESDEELVAYRAGMDVRTANWHRAILTGLLGLDKDVASRGELLARAAELGVLPKRARIRPDGMHPVPAAPNTDGSRQRRIALRMTIQLVLPGLEHLPRVPRQPAPPRTASAPARREIHIVWVAQPLALPAHPVLEAVT